MFCHKLQNWPIFNSLEPTNIRVAVVYGDLGDNALVATFCNKVYNIRSINNNKTKDILCSIKIDQLPGDDIKTFACSKNHSLILTNSGKVYLQDLFTITKLNHCPDIFVMDIASGYDHFLALSNKGQVHMCKNASSFEEMGDALTNKIITDISCGKDFSIVVTNTGEVYSWGVNDVGQLGIGNKSVETVYKITTLDDVVIEKVVCGYSHILALSRTGVLYVWGGNSCGQLGLNTTTNAFVPVKLRVKEMEKVWDIAACYASHISVAIAENNHVFIWGQCIGQNILTPTHTSLTCLHDAFAYYSWPRVTYQPLVFYDERNSNLLTSIRKAFNDPVTSDFTIIVEEKPIYVHKAILKIRCHYFRTMFEKVWVESNKCVMKHEQFSYNVYKSFLNYLYTDEILLSSNDDIVELLSLTDMYFMKRLRNRCSRILIKTITINNIVHLYDMSIKYKIKDLQKHCFKFALNHMTAVVQSPDFINLDRDILQDFLQQAAKAGVFKT